MQLALYPSLPPLDPSCILSTGRKKNRETAERGAQAGQAKAYRQTVQWANSGACPSSSKSTSLPNKKQRQIQSLRLVYHHTTVTIVTITFSQRESGDIVDFGVNPDKRQGEPHFIR